MPLGWNIVRYRKGNSQVGKWAVDTPCGSMICARAGSGYQTRRCFVCAVTQVKKEQFVAKSHIVRVWVVMSATLRTPCRAETRHIISSHATKLETVAESTDVTLGLGITLCCSLFYLHHVVNFFNGVIRGNVFDVVPRGLVEAWPPVMCCRLSGTVDGSVRYRI